MNIDIETINEEDIMPFTKYDSDNITTTKFSFSERAEACEEFISQLRELDSAEELELENEIKLVQPKEGNR